MGLVELNFEVIICLIKKKMYIDYIYLYKK